MGGDLAQMAGELASLRSRYKDFSFTLINGRGRRKRIEAVRARGDQSLYAVITDDPGEMRDILNAALQLPRGPVVPQQSRSARGHAGRTGLAPGTGAGLVRPPVSGRWRGKTPRLAPQCAEAHPASGQGQGRVVLMPGTGDALTAGMAGWGTPMLVPVLWPFPGPGPCFSTDGAGLTDGTSS